MNAHYILTWKFAVVALGGLVISFVCYRFSRRSMSSVRQLVKQSQKENSTKLNLDSQDISIIDPTIENLPYLEYMSLKMNRLTENSFVKPNGKPISFCALQRLTSLELRNNNLQKLPRSFMTFPASLQNLNLSVNEIQELDQDIIQNLQLQKLSLHCNKLTRIPVEIASLTNLQSLDLSFNKLTHLPAEIASLIQLEDLRLSGNCLSRLPENIGNLEKLKVFEISSNKISILPDSFIKLTNLVRLALGDNQLVSLPKGVHLLIQLENLTCYSNKLESLPSKIGCLKKLKTLHCHQNKLTTLPDSFYDLIELTSLNLSHNLLEELSPKIGQLVLLQDLNLLSNTLKSVPKEMTNLKNCVLELRENYSLLDIPESITGHKTLSVMWSLPIEVIPKKLYMGGWEAAKHRDALKHRNITHILQLANTDTILYPDDFEYLVLDVKDKSSENILPHFKTTNQHIDQIVHDPDSAILIICMMGVSRSPAFVIAYMMYSQNISYQEAHDILKNKTNLINPNKGFQKQLQEYEKMLTIIKDGYCGSTPVTPGRNSHSNNH